MFEIIQECHRIHRIERIELNERNGAIEHHICMTVCRRRAPLNRTAPSGWKEVLSIAAMNPSGKLHGVWIVRKMVAKMKHWTIHLFCSFAFQIDHIHSFVVKMCRSIRAC